MRILAAMFTVVALVLVVVGPTYAAAADMTWNEFGAFFRGETDPDECSATGRTVVSITHKVINDDDSGVAGNYWATDAYSRLLTIVEVQAPVSPGGVGKYCAVTQYFGDFVTVAGPSPQDTCTVPAGVKGIFRGGYRSVTFDGVLNPSPSKKISGNLGTFDYACDGSGNCSGLFDWTATYFVGPLVGWDYAWWGWMYYAYTHGSWINSSGGNSGDICS
jgi:hypothetical protein